jgi:hypothetical protein
MGALAPGMATADPHREAARPSERPMALDGPPIALVLPNHPACFTTIALWSFPPGAG